MVLETKDRSLRNGPGSEPPRSAPVGSFGGPVSVDTERRERERWTLKVFLRTMYYVRERVVFLSTWLKGRGRRPDEVEERPDFRTTSWTNVLSRPRRCRRDDTGEVTGRPRNQVESVGVGRGRSIIGTCVMKDPESKGS